MRLLLVGYGRMGRLVEQHAPAHGCEIAGVVRSATVSELEFRDYGKVDAVIDFSHGGGVCANVERIATRGWNLVIGTTGWQSDEAACRQTAERVGIGVLAAANFSIGVHIFRAVVADAARRFNAVEAGAWINELHHSAKKDAPSGTALMLKQAMEQGGYSRAIDVASTRAGSIPGTHEVGFDAAAETVMLTHTVRDRAVFAHGAIAAAKWLQGRRGWFSMRDMIEL